MQARIAELEDDYLSEGVDYRTLKVCCLNQRQRCVIKNLRQQISDIIDSGSASPPQQLMMPDGVTPVMMPDGTTPVFIP